MNDDVASGGAQLDFLSFDCLLFGRDTRIADKSAQWPTRSTILCVNSHSERLRDQPEAGFQMQQTRITDHLITHLLDLERMLLNRKQCQHRCDYQYPHLYFDTIKTGMIAGTLGAGLLRVFIGIGHLARLPSRKSKMINTIFRPLHDRVVVRRIEVEAKTKGGIIIPDTAREKPQEGEIVAVGSGARDEGGKIVPLDVKAGDRILFGKWSGTEIKFNGEDLLIMKEADVLGIIA